MTGDPVLEHRERVQAAIGVLVAHDEGRADDVRRLLGEIGEPGDAVAAFFTVAQLATASAAHRTGAATGEMLRDLALDVARAESPGG